jgi:hypothetical protein
MNLQRMLEMCRRDQWEVGDLDWSGKPRPMSKSDEMAICQYFTDMAAIERLAAALFDEQMRRATDETLREIFATFIKDELRHAHVAQMLGDYYDVHRYKPYYINEHLRRFAPHFVSSVRFLPTEIANGLITSGELILDVALLRSLNDYVNDDMSRRAMELINRDESRHVAVDFYMLEHYTSDEYLAELSREHRPLVEHLQGAWAMLHTSWYARPFFRAVFFEPMALVDPSRERLQEAMKRIQLIGAKPNVARRPLARMLRAVQSINNTPVVGKVFSTLFSRMLLVEPELYRRLTSDAEEARAATMSFDKLAEEALAIKYAG